MFYNLELPTRGSRQMYELRKNINKEGCDYYVYGHIKNEKIIYIGMGTFKNYKNTDSQQRCFTNMDRSYNIDEFVDKICIVDFYYEKDFALEVEAELTNTLKECATWTIYNKYSGNKVNDEAKRKISKTWDSKTSSEKELIKKKISNAHKGKKVSDETRNKLSELFKGSKNPMYGKIGRFKKVLCVTTGKIFDTIKEGAKYYGIKSPTTISQCCGGKRKSAGKYKGEKLIWKYYEE